MIHGIWKLGVLVLLSLLTRVAGAEPSAADRATARVLATEGYRALKKREYELACDRFTRADALVHAPTLLVDWGRALAGLGKLVEAQEKFELVIREGVDAKAPPSWHRAFETARIELEKIKPRLAWLTIRVTASNEPSVTIDGVLVPAASLSVRRAINPGMRATTFTAPDCESVDRTDIFAEGEARAIDVTLVCSAAPTRTATAVTAPSNQAARVLKRGVPKRKVEPRAKSRRALTYVAFGAGTVGLAVGSVFGALAVAKHSELQDECTRDGVCPRAQQSSIDEYHRLGTVSVVGFALGLSGAALGITSLLTEPNETRESGSIPGLRAYVSTSSLGARGWF